MCTNQYRPKYSKDNKKDQLTYLRQLSKAHKIMPKNAKLNKQAKESTLYSPNMKI